MRKIEEADGVDVGHGDAGVLDLGRLATAQHKNTGKGMDFHLHNKSQVPTFVCHRFVFRVFRSAVHFCGLNCQHKYISNAPNSTKENANAM